MSERAGLAEISAVGGQIIRQFRSDVGDAWEGRLNAAERALLESAAADAAVVLLFALAGREEEARRERAHVDAQLRNLTSIGSARVARQFWVAADRAARRAIAVALGLL
jgi:hypothetical protein